MVIMTLPIRMLIALFCAGLSLFPRSLLTSQSATIALITLLPHTANAVAIPEAVHVLPYATYYLERRSSNDLPVRTWASEDPPCTESNVPSSSGTCAGHSSLEPVTVTATVWLSTSTSNPATSTTSGGAYAPPPNTNGTIAYGSSSSSSSASTTGTSPSVVPTPTVDPIIASAQHAQRLNAAFQSLRGGDACTPGQRACISGQIAQCSIPPTPSDTPKWILQNCLLGSDPNQVSVCAAVPDFSASSSPSTQATTANATSTSSPVVLGCFNPTDIVRLFERAGIQGGMLPPGMQASAAQRLLAGKELSGLGLGALMALVVTSFV